MHSEPPRAVHVSRVHAHRPAPSNPFRVTRRGDPSGPPLTAPQRAVLLALVDLCPTPGADVDALETSERSGVRHGATVNVLRSLVDKRLALMFDEVQPERWAPSYQGRIRARHLLRDARPAAPTE